MIRNLIISLGGKKMAALLAGVIATAAVAGMKILAAKYGFDISDTQMVLIQGAITAKVIALILGQSYADGQTAGATSSAQWPEVKDAEAAKKVIDAAVGGDK